MNDYSKIDWKSLVYYDPAVPSGLRWVSDRFSGEYYNVLNAKAGDVAGSIHSGGYYRLGLGYNSYATSRIVWLLHNGYLPNNLFIDHINGNRADNSIENLRLVNRKQNNRNRCRHKNNSSGVVGVRLDMANPKCPCWVATWAELDGRKCSKWFSINKYGDKTAFDLACKHREDKIALLNLSGAGYSDRHGDVIDIQESIDNQRTT